MLNKKNLVVFGIISIFGLFSVNTVSAQEGDMENLLNSLQEDTENKTNTGDNTNTDENDNTENILNSLQEDEKKTTVNETKFQNGFVIENYKVNQVVKYKVMKDTVLNEKFVIKDLKNNKNLQKNALLSNKIKDISLKDNIEKGKILYVELSSNYNKIAMFQDNILKPIKIFKKTNTSGEGIEGDDVYIFQNKEQEKETTVTNTENTNTEKEEKKQVDNEILDNKKTGLKENIIVGIIVFFLILTLSLNKIGRNENN